MKVCPLTFNAIVLALALCATDIPALAQSVPFHSNIALKSEQHVPGMLSGSARNEAPLLHSTDPGAERFIAAGKLLTGRTGGYNCTASLVAGKTPPPPNRPALILTAGHCVDDEMGSNTVIVNRPAPGGWLYTPNYFIDTTPEHHSVVVDHIVYATMKGMDLAILQLKATYGELAARGVHPLQLEPSVVSAGTPIELAHIPVIGVPEDERFLRHSLCQVSAGVTPLVEGIGPWFWVAAVPNDCKGVAGGTSGSPVFKRDGTTVIGILNTKVEPDYTGCGLGRPCEPTETGDFSREGSSYYIPVDRIARAIKDDGTIDVTWLDKGTGIQLERTKPGWISQRYEEIDGQQQPARWHLRIDDNGFDRIMYKVGSARSIDCSNATGYQGPIPAASQPFVNLGLPTQEGVFAICVLGAHTGEGVYQPATIWLRQIDDTPPTIAPVIHERGWEGEKEVIPAFSLWELVDLYIKFGALEQTDCSDRDGYRQFTRQWTRVDEKQPWRFCAYGTDQAGNAGPPVNWDYSPTRH
ncbi:serine protease [Dyella sp. M7H15-1]|uniref:S1 family peptidase n=1 Tax=Dyella sp. M7H15-1 TaxID=2501295 RepID=UPI001004D825|nr:serine protease [Dyella sp. M7H15-1]QAU23312.1 serine protease [Dyella sp. M7H15-1]